jgi:NAD(P)-dependent dehydrogenase (short-subunit alcohol dehydrogenase family)
MTKTVVITGGSAGIGLAASERFAREGWQVAVVARHEGRLKETEARLRAMGVKALGIEADVADEKAMFEAAARVERELGPIDVWVNNAMSSIVAPAWDVSGDEYRRVTEVTYLGQVFGTLAALKYMRARRRGTVIQINSVIGIRAFPLQTPYAGAKGAAMNWTNGLRAELAHERLPIEISTIYLPAVNSTQFDGWARNRTGKRQIAPDPVYDPRLAANAIFFAAENPRRDIWVGRTTILGAIVQRLWPKGGDMVAKSGWDGQLGEPIGEIEGNLFKPAEGSARIDGPSGDRTLSSRHTYLTSRQRDAVVLGGLALVAAGVAHLVARRTGI